MSARRSKQNGKVVFHASEATYCKHRSGTGRSGPTTLSRSQRRRSRQPGPERLRWRWQRPRRNNEQCGSKRAAGRGERHHATCNWHRCSDGGHLHASHRIARHATGELGCGRWRASTRATTGATDSDAIIPVNAIHATCPVATAHATRAACAAAASVTTATAIPAATAEPDAANCSVGSAGRLFR